MPELAIALACTLPLAACKPDPVPKPRGYFRIDLPEQRYAVWEHEAPFSAEVPAHVRMLPRPTENDSRWFDMWFTGQRATMHLTWSPIRGDLQNLIEDAHTFKGKHESMATRIGRERIMRPGDRVFGTLFHVDGDVASPMVFYLTDSVQHFLYGALYFEARPNADSLAPVTDRIRSDIRHFAVTLRWSP